MFGLNVCSCSLNAVRCQPCWKGLTNMQFLAKSITLSWSCAIGALYVESRVSLGRVLALHIDVSAVDQHSCYYLRTSNTESCQFRVDSRLASRILTKITTAITNITTQSPQTDVFDFGALLASILAGKSGRNPYMTRLIYKKHKK